MKSIIFGLLLAMVVQGCNVAENLGNVQQEKPLFSVNVVRSTNMHSGFQTLPSPVLCQNILR